MLNNLQIEGVITDAVSLSSLAGISSDPVGFFVSKALRIDAILATLGQRHSKLDH